MSGGIGSGFGYFALFRFISVAEEVASEQSSSVLDRLTERSREVLRIASSMAHAQNRAMATPVDLLLGMIRERDGVAAHVLARFGITEGMLGSGMDMLPVDQVTSVELLEMQRETGLSSFLAFAADESRLLGHRYIGTEHLLLAFCRLYPQDLERLPEGVAVNPQDLMKECVNVVRGNIANWKKHHADIDFSTGVEIY